MSRWSSGALEALTYASLIFASGIGFAAASPECAQGYRICNGGCAQAIEATDHAAVCRTRCSFQLMACDKTQPMGSDRVDGKQLGEIVLERPSKEKPLAE
jgi:hypothetical protein